MTMNKTQSITQGRRAAVDNFNAQQYRRRRTQLYETIKDIDTPEMQERARNLEIELGLDPPAKAKASKARSKTKKKK